MASAFFFCNTQHYPGQNPPALPPCPHPPALSSTNAASTSFPRPPGRTSNELLLLQDEKGLERDGGSRHLGDTPPPSPQSGPAGVDGLVSLTSSGSSQCSTAACRCGSAFETSLFPLTRERFRKVRPKLWFVFTPLSTTRTDSNHCSLRKKNTGGGVLGGGSHS